MNILGCLDKPSSGRYLLEGTNVAEHDKKALALIRNQRIGFVFQGFNLLARTTALEIQSFPPCTRKLITPSAGAAPPKRWRWLGWRIALNISPRRCREASNSAWRSLAPW